MNSYPKYAQIENTKYKINTNYKVALQCEKVAKSEVPEEERALAVIYLLFGDKGLKDSQNWQQLLQIGMKYLNCGREINEEEIEVNMDFEQDWEYIRTSFFYDYKIKLNKNTYMHWWEFFNLLCGLSEKWAKQKEQLSLKKEDIKTSEERRLDELFEKQLRGG